MGNLVYFRVRWDNSNFICSFPLGYAVDIDKWSEDTKQCLPNTTHPNRTTAAFINRRIQLFEETTEKLFKRYDEQGILPTIDEFKEDFNVAVGRKKVQPKGSKINMLKAYKDFEDAVSLQNNWAYGTAKKFTTLQHIIEEHFQDTTVGEMDKDFMQLFYSKLIKHGYNNTTINTRLRCMKQFIHWLEANDMYDGNAATYSVRMRGVHEHNVVVYLTWDELIDLYSMKIDEPFLDRVRDVFCFCCFTSLRYSDASKLQKSDIKNDCIDIVTQKTAEPLTIELNDYSRAILKKYEDTWMPNNMALPVISNQKMNNYLKELAKLAGLKTPIKKVYYYGSTRKERVFEKWELITTHCGRRTFIVNALYLGIPAEVVMKWTGHADYAAMRPYIAIVDELKSREMDKFNKGKR